VVYWLFGEYGLKLRFCVKTTKEVVFPATKVARFWVSQATCHFVKITGANDTSSALLNLKKE